jgi:hypothetical protein
MQRPARSPRQCSRSDRERRVPHAYRIRAAMGVGGSTGRVPAPVAVEVLASPVVDRRRARVGVPGGDLDVAKRHPGVERRHDERRSEHVRAPPVRGARPRGAGSPDLTARRRASPPIGETVHNVPVDHGTRARTAAPAPRRSALTIGWARAARSGQCVRRSAVASIQRSAIPPETSRSRLPA